MEYRDCYQILGQERAASQDEIKRTYRKLAYRCHLDTMDEADAEDRLNLTWQSRTRYALGFTSADAPR